MAGRGGVAIVILNDDSVESPCIARASGWQPFGFHIGLTLRICDAAPVIRFRQAVRAGSSIAFKLHVPNQKSQVRVEVVGLALEEL